MKTRHRGSEYSPWLRIVGTENGRGRMETRRPSAGPAVFVVEDDSLFRELLVRLLAPVGLPIHSYPSAEAFLERFDPANAGCLLLDVRLPGMDGLSLFGTVRAFGARLPAVFLTGYADVATVRRALLGGAADFLEKPVDSAKLLAAVNAALEADLEARRSAALCAGLEGLTPREWDVLECVVAGKPNKIISCDLGISQKTVEAHRARLMSKAGAGSVADLVRMFGAFEALKAESRPGA